MDVNPTFVCVNCGEYVPNLFKRYNATVLKLVECTKCHQVADKYVEYDPVIIMIDVTLFNKEAFRHILYNTDFKIHWKLAVLWTLVESYDRWVQMSHEKGPITVPFLRMSGLVGPEQLFYFSCFISLLGQIAFCLVLIFFILVYWKLNSKTKPSTGDLFLIWKAISCSSFGHVLVLPSLIWGDFGVEIHKLFVLGYTFITQYQAISVICSTNTLQIISAICIAYFCKFSISHIFYTASNVLHY